MYENIDFDQIDLSGPAPEQEPERQYYFMAIARELVRRQSEKLGRPLTACTTTFGCQMNARDSEKLEGILEAVGY
ncbi:MAG: tRNA (N6-isopentenyl adenosine(37)-C2)-methylthiotransferase MiaB, partial [Lachnospiraceae bacterium]|nr:tRNA (N6-isopentenyl adenosine(37)-C2)-methylthiotransferase MiaB [Lachnospiraceae bacterium]